MKARVTVPAQLATLLAAGCGAADGQRLAVKQAILDSAPGDGEPRIRILSISARVVKMRARKAERDVCA
jgi:hypothetical protein